MKEIRSKKRRYFLFWHPIPVLASLFKCRCGRWLPFISFFSPLFLCVSSYTTHKTTSLFPWIWTSITVSISTILVHRKQDRKETKIKLSVKAKHLIVDYFTKSKKQIFHDSNFRGFVVIRFKISHSLSMSQSLRAMDNSFWKPGNYKKTTRRIQKGHAWVKIERKKVESNALTFIFIASWTWCFVFFFFFSLPFLDELGCAEN